MRTCSEFATYETHLIPFELDKVYKLIDLSKSWSRLKHMCTCTGIPWLWPSLLNLLYESSCKPNQNLKNAIQWSNKIPAIYSKVNSSWKPADPLMLKISIHTSLFHSPRQELNLASSMYTKSAFPTTFFPTYCLFTDGGSRDSTSFLGRSTSLS